MSFRLEEHPILIGQRIAVVGAGIGGLAAAIALARHGAQVTVLERADAIRELGAGIQISPNGAAVLAALGLLDRVAAGAPRGRRVHLREHARGRVVTTLDLSKLDDAGPWLLVHRADLIAVLETAAREAGVAIRTGAGAAELTGQGVRLACGGEVAADLVVAADGARSTLRRHLEPEAAAPAFLGQVAWRAIVPLDAPAPPEVSVWMGPGRHLVAYPLRDGRSMNVVAVREEAEWAPEGWTEPDRPEALAAAFADFAPDVQRLLAGVGCVHRWGLFRRPVARRWQDGRLALLGDAAHATLPFLAQGACMALEDAWVLAERLAASDGIAAGLAAYEAARAARCRRIVAAADLNARVYHLRAAPVRALAHAGLRAAGQVAPGAALARFDWLYRHDVTA